MDHLVRRWGIINNRYNRMMSLRIWLLKREWLKRRNKRHWGKLRKRKMPQWMQVRTMRRLKRWNINNYMLAIPRVEARWCLSIIVLTALWSKLFFMLKWILKHLISSLKFLTNSQFSNLNRTISKPQMGLSQPMIALMTLSPCRTRLVLSLPIYKSTIPNPTNLPRASTIPTLWWMTERSQVQASTNLTPTL